MLVHAVFLLLAIAGLESANVDIRLADQAAEVRAVYRLNDVDSTVVFHAFRPDSGLQQLVTFDGRVADRMVNLSGRDALWQVVSAVPRAESEGGRTVTATFKYRVEGDLTRIPIFVPDTPASPQSPQLVIRVSNASTECAGEDLFPRFERRAGDVLVARPGNLPSFVLRGCGFGRIGAGRVADTVVILLVLGGTIGWLVWRHRTKAHAVDRPTID